MFIPDRMGTGGSTYAITKRKSNVIRDKMDQFGSGKHAEVGGECGSIKKKKFLRAWLLALARKKEITRME
ncbi:hypothetical protein ACH5RR_006453 [Cinchona calisaya]|uniref:Uncharacterized protein n=1 Tax=Cinchona calisaya TaxID=153742 RepID=A0ABD3APB9_9GENT